MNLAPSQGTLPALELVNPWFVATGTYFFTLRRCCASEVAICKASASGGEGDMASQTFRSVGSIV